MSTKRRLFLLCLVVCLVISATAALSACKGTTYSVTYEKGNNSAVGESPETLQYKAGDEVTVADNTFTLDGYDFVGWSDGSKTYQKGETFTMPENDVTLTAQWKLKQTGGDEPTPPIVGGDEKDEPTLAELNSKVYVASNWKYMTNNNGAATDGGDIVYGLNDGSVKFHRVNQAIDLGEKITKASFMLKSTHDFKLWFNSSSKDNNANNSYRLTYEYDELRLVVSTAGDKSAAKVTSTFELGKWNRIDIEFNETVNPDTDRTVCSIKLYVNGERATLAAGENTTQITVADNTLNHTQVGNFETGTWLVAKVWDACDYFQIKPVSKANEKDVPIIAAIGASITEGAGASNFYTESYPAQLQNALGGAYNVVNFGKSGRTVRTDLPSNPGEDPTPWLQNKQWGGVQAIKPDIAIINMGTNDSKTSNVPATTIENFTEAYNHLLDELLKVNEEMRIIVCTVPYAYSDIYGINNDNIANIVAPVQRSIAAEREMELVDLYQITQNKSLLFGDGVHPGTRGYAMFTEVLSKVVKEGADAITKEFLNDIDERYNDPENFSIEDIRASLAVSGEQINLTVTGKIEFSDTSYLRLVADISDGQERFAPITLEEDGTFSVSMRIDDLTSDEWYIIRVYLTENYGEIVMLNQTDYAVNDEFTTSTRKVIVKSWSDRFNLKLEDYNPLAAAIEVTNLAFDDGNLVVTGTANEAVETLRLYLYNSKENIDTYFVDVTIGSNGEFTAQIGLEQLTIADNEWYYLWSSINGGDKQNVKYAHDESIKHQYENRVYKFTGWDGNVAIVYSTLTVSENFVTLTSVKVVEQGGKINLTLIGTTNDDGLRFYIGADPANNEKYNHYENITVGTDGEFTFTFDLGTCPVGGWYNIRLYYSDNEYYAVSYEQAVNGNGATLKVNDVFYGTNTSVTVKSWDDKAGTVKTFSIEVKAYDSSYTVSAESITFDDGYFVLTGTLSNVRSLYVYLINTNVADSTSNYVEAEISGSGFTARLPLATLAGYSKTGTPFNLRYKVNDISKDTENVAPAEMDMTQVAWSDTKIFYLGTNNGCVAVYYTTDFKYGLTEASIKSVGGKATLVIAGILQDNTILPETVYLLLDENGNGTGKQKILAENKAAAAGTFRFEVDVSVLESSTEASASNGADSRHYYIRLYNGESLTVENYTSGTKLADVNSRWLADKLFKAFNIVGDSSDYYFIRNTTNATYNTLGIIRVGKDASAIKTGDIDNVTLNYYAQDSVTIDLSDFVDANGTTVTYSVSVGDSAIAQAQVTGSMLCVTAKGLYGSTTITVTVLSDGERAFDLAFDVTLNDSVITKTNNYQSFLSADSWQDIVNDGNDKPWFDGNTNSVILQWGNIYQQIGASSHISFELWVNASGDYGFEIWFRSTTNDKNVTGKKYVINGYNEPISISRDGVTLGTMPRFNAGEFTRFDITMLDVYEGDVHVKTLINIYINGQKINLQGNSVINGTIVDNDPIAEAEGIYFALKAWKPQVAIRTAEEIANPSAIKVAAVGDSITYGHSWHSESYPTYLATELGNDYNVGNFGLNGASVTGFGGSSLKYASQTQYTNSVNFAPDIIVVMLGANDANGWANASATYESDLRAIIASYQTACPNATILLVTSAPTLENNQFGIPNETIKNDVNPIQRSVAADLGLKLVDLRAEMEAADGGYSGFFRDDGVHLSVDGAKFAATVIGNAIKTLD